MSGNSIGQHLTLTTYGESHGPAIGGVLDGAPAGIPLDLDAIQRELDRRKPGTSRHVTPRQEDDRVQLLSGLFEGTTTGTPIGIHIANTNQRSQDYGAIKNQYRPGHADYTYQAKYGIRDYRGGGRASARETAVRVAGGAIAKQILAYFAGTTIRSYLSQIGEHRLEFRDWHHVQDNPFNCPNDHQTALLDRYLADIRRAGDSIGAEITVVAEGVPTGLGEPVFDRLDADIAKALMSINAVKGFDYGDGFDGVFYRGSEHNDLFFNDNGKVSTRTNYSGCIQGGISNGQDIYFRVAFKAVSTVLRPQATVDTDYNETILEAKGRHDPCVLPRAVPIVEAMAAMTVLDYRLAANARSFSQGGV